LYFSVSAISFFSIEVSTPPG